MTIGKLKRMEAIGRYKRYWIKEGFSEWSVHVFYHLRTKKQDDLIRSCRNTREALTKLEATK